MRASRASVGARRGRRRRWPIVAVVCAVLIAAVVAIVVVVAGQGQGQGAGPEEADAGPRPLTTEEAERLAVVRFLHFQAGGLTFQTTVETPDGEVALDGSVDYRSEIGTAAITIGAQGDDQGDDQGDAQGGGVLQWDAMQLAVWLDGGAPADAPAAAPSGAPTAAPDTPPTIRPLDPSSSSVDTVLALLGGLALDRPDNAQLLQQSDARWLRADEVDGTPVDVLAGPSPAGAGAGAGGGTGSGEAGALRYWVDADGALLRLEIDLPGTSVVVDCTTEGFVPVARAPLFAAAPTP